MRVISYGGGVQSTALVVLAVQGHLGPVDAALFANVGDDSEEPDTLRYVREVSQPWAAERGLTVIELQRHTAHGDTLTLLGQMQRTRSVPIPIRGSNGAPGKRTCTTEFKIKIIGKWLLQRGCSPERRADVLIGFAKDEAARVNTDDSKRKTRAERCQRSEYPLIDLNLTTAECVALIERAGLPVPPKSACYFCPYRRPSRWAAMRRDKPALFAQAAEIEHFLSARREARGDGPLFLTRYAKPLAEAIGTDVQPQMDFGTGPGETCDEGYCWT